MFTAITVGSVVTVLMPPDQTKSLCKTLMAPSKGFLRDRIYKSLTEVDVQKAEASVAEDQARILQIIRAPEGPGVAKFNLDVQRFVKNWFIDTLENKCQQLLREPFSFDEKAELCCSIGHMLFDHGDYGRAMGMLRSGMDFMNAHGKQDVICGARILQEIAFLEMKQGHYEQSAAAFAKSKHIYLEHDAFESEAGAVSCDRFGALLRKTNDLEGAMDVFMEGYRMREHLKILVTPSGGSLLGNIGHVRELQGDLDGAKKMYEDALHIRDQTASLKTPGGALLLTSIGSLSERQVDLDNARMMYEEARQIRIQTGSMMTPAAALLLKSIASLNMRQGDLDGAREAYATALEILRCTGMLDTPQGMKLEEAVSELQAVTRKRDQMIKRKPHNFMLSMNVCQ